MKSVKQILDAVSDAQFDLTELSDSDKLLLNDDAQSALFEAFERIDKILSDACIATIDADRLLKQLAK